MAGQILVVDDDRNIGQILHASFSAKGYEVYIARNGEDALSEFKKVVPDIVLLDVLLPKMNGWEVCKAIKETSQGQMTPVILMSAVYKSPKLQREARETYGADQFVEKPFQLSRLMDMVVELIGEPDAPKRPKPVETADEGGAEEAAAKPNGQAAATDDAVDEDLAASFAPDAAVEAEDAAPIPEEGQVKEITGDLAAVTFPELLHDLYVMGKSGYMTLETDGKKKEVAVMDGYPVSVKTNLSQEYFGNFLVGQHVITEDQCDEAVKRMQESGRLLGTVLIEMDILTPQQVVNYLRMQVREKLFEVFGWEGGTYKFTFDTNVTGDIQSVEMSVANIINMGVTRHYSLPKLESLTERYRDMYLHLGSNRRYRFQDLELTPTESKLLASIDGTATFEEILGYSELARDRTLQILYTLIVAGMVEPQHESTAEPQTRFDYGQGPSEGDTKAFAESLVEGSSIPATGIPQREDGEEAAEPVREEDGAVRSRVLQFYEKLGTDNMFQLLGVADSPTEHEVRIGYHKLAKEFHPDRYFGKTSAEIKAKVEEIFRSINDAYDALNTQEKINVYKKKLEGEGETEASQSRLEGVKNVIFAEQRFQAAQQFLREQRYTRAAAALKQALEVAPNEPEYVAYYGWALYNIPYEQDADEEELAMRPKDSMADMQFEAREALNRAISINPRTEKAYLFLGSIYKRQGLSEFAEKQYEKALICNPNCIEALRELRLIKLKEQQAKDKKDSSILTSLFGGGKKKKKR
ncbi:MAG: response regulator [Deltaproteobacteria bacterium]|nr:response regulator [Deltaproteobacteria bacterium]MCB9490300.1 response regulator [Deltaproteobacteria bacterium]